MRAVYYSGDAAEKAPWGNAIREAINTYANWSGYAVHILTLDDAGKADYQSLLFCREEMHGNSLQYRAFRIVTAILSLGIIPALAECFGRLLNACLLHQYTIDAQLFPTCATSGRLVWNRDQWGSNAKIDMTLVFQGKTYTATDAQYTKQMMPYHIKDRSDDVYRLLKPLSENICTGFNTCPSLGSNDGRPVAFFYKKANLITPDENMDYYKTFDGTRDEWLLAVAEANPDTDLDGIIYRAYPSDSPGSLQDERIAAKRTFVEHLARMTKDEVQAHPVSAKHHQTIHRWITDPMLAIGSCPAGSTQTLRDKFITSPFYLAAPQE